MSKQPIAAQDFIHGSVTAFRGKPVEGLSSSAIKDLEKANLLKLGSADAAAKAKEEADAAAKAKEEADAAAKAKEEADAAAKAKEEADAAAKAKEEADEAAKAAATKGSGKK